MNEYRNVQKRLAQGWNTWDTRSVLHNYINPEALRIRLGVKASASSTNLTEAFV